MKCPNCGGTVQPGVDRCVKCGSYVEQPVAQQQPGQPVVPQQAGGTAEVSDKSKVAAGVLGIFLGWLGIHRLYLGYGSIGGLQLALGIVGLVTSGICIGLPILCAMSLWGLVEGIMILTGAINRDGQGRLLKN